MATAKCAHSTPPRHNDEDSVPGTGLSSLPFTTSERLADEEVRPVIE